MGVHLPPLDPDGLHQLPLRHALLRRQQHLRLRLSGARVRVGPGSSWVSVAGNAEIVRDVAKAKELWNAGLDAWFPDGPETPGLVLVKVHADTAEYWDTPGGKVMTLLSYAKAKV